FGLVLNAASRFSGDSGSSSDNNSETHAINLKFLLATIYRSNHRISGFTRKRNATDQFPNAGPSHGGDLAAETLSPTEYQPWFDSPPQRKVDQLLAADPAQTRAGEPPPYHAGNQVNDNRPCNSQNILFVPDVME